MIEIQDLFNELLSATKASEVDKILLELGDRIEWTPIGGNKGNFGIISMGVDPFDGITERITNAIDAMIELQVELNPRLRSCPNPRKATEAMHRFKDGSLRWCNSDQTGVLASDIKVKFLDSENPKKPTIEVWDRGIGQHPLDFPKTLLGLNEDYKVSKLYLMGAFGQGGQTSFANCDYGIVVSRKHPKLLPPGQEDRIGWSIVRYTDPTTKDIIYKKGYWEYCVEAQTQNVLTANPLHLSRLFENGTLIRLVSYQIPKGTSDVLQPASTAWSYLSQSLFDPLLPIRLYEARERFQSKNRSLAGLANRLWGGGKGEKTTIWKSDSYRLELGDRGSVWINYWALSPTDEFENWRDVKKGYVSHNHCVFITLNGQTHSVETTTFLRDRVGLIYSGDYVIVQLNLDELTNQSKKELLSTTRKDLKEGEFKEELMEEIIQHLKLDRNLLAFERERKMRILSHRTERDISNIRKMIGRFISKNPELTGLILSVGKDRTEGEKSSRKPPELKEEDEIREEELIVPELKPAPTYLRIANTKDPIPIEKGGNALIRLETDAMDSYFENEWELRFRCIHEMGITTRRSCSRLRNGKISYYLHCPPSVRLGTKEKLMFQLDLPDSRFLSASCTVVCITPYERRKLPGEQKLPQPKIIPISKESDPSIWAQFGWCEDSVGRVFLEKEGKPGIYVSLDNKHLKKVLQKRLKDGIATGIEDRYIAGVAYYLLLREVHRLKHKTEDELEGNGAADDSPELDRLAETVSVLSVPIEILLAEK